MNYTSNEDPEPTFGRTLTAMITPFGSDGQLDLQEAAKLAVHLVDELGNDGLIINGTTGEAPTTTDQEKADLLRAVSEAVGDRASIVAGIGTFSTEHSVNLAQQAQEAGASGLLVVSPYYSRPPVDALENHHLTVAGATDLPVMLYDIPHRVGIPIPEESIIRLAEHSNIIAVKDAKGDVVSSSDVIRQTGLDYYAGDDAMLLPLLSVGGVGLVGTSSHFSGLQVKSIIDAHVAGDVAAAIANHRNALAVFRGVFATQGCMMVKAGLNSRGWNVGPCRPPMGTVPENVLTKFLAQLDELLGR